VPWQEFVFRFPLTVAHFALMIINEPAVRIRDVVTGQTKSKSESRVNKLYKRQLQISKRMRGGVENKDRKMVSKISRNVCQGPI